VGSAPQGTFLLPAYVSTDADNDSFHDPDALLFEGEAPLKDGQQVKARSRPLVLNMHGASLPPSRRIFFPLSLFLSTFVYLLAPRSFSS
jgi:hypothetical protein